jgi:hypothetical protein
MSDYELPKGPEDIPLKGYVKVHPLVIIIKDIKSSRRIREERINYSEPEQRRWLGRITHWATTNGYSVETMSEADFEVEE